MITYIFSKNNYASLYNNLFEINRNDKTLKTILDGLQKQKIGFIKVSFRKSWFDWRQNRWLTFILGHQRRLGLPAHFRSTSGDPNSWLELLKIYISHTRTGKHRKWTRDDFGLGKANHDQSWMITRERDLKTIKNFWIDFL